MENIEPDEPVPQVKSLSDIEIKLSDSLKSVLRNIKKSKQEEIQDEWELDNTLKNGKKKMVQNYRKPSHKNPG